MNITKKALLFVFSTLTLTSLAAQGKLDSQIKSYYTQQDALTRKKDGPGLETLMTSHTTTDYVNVGKPNKNGKSASKSLAQNLAQMKQTLPFIDKFLKVNTRIDKVTVGRGSCVVTISTDVSMLTKKDPSGKTHTFESHDSSEDTWIKIGSAWKCRLSKTISDGMKIDGKSFPGM